MLLGRLLGWLLVGAALVAVGRDALASWQMGAWSPAPLAQLWTEIDRDSLEAFRAGGPRAVSFYPPLWDWLATPVLGWPAWAVFLVPGVLLLVLCRRRRRRSSFV
ncbi:MAG: hypothetical protein AB7P02_02615 [Alphaproteobacteria bacterium]